MVVAFRLGLRESSLPLAANPGEPDQWRELMAMAQAGHGGAYHRLLVEITPWLRRFYARRLPADEVEDTVQDTLVAIHSKRHTFDTARPFRPWLTAIARYKWIDRLRRLGREATDALDENQAIGDHESLVTSAIVLDEMLAQLKPAQASVIRLVKLEGLSPQEAGRITGQSTSLVRVNIHRGLAKLQAVVRDRDQPD